MGARLSQVHWNLVLKTGVLIYVLTLILGLGVSLFLPAFFNWGHLDPQSAFQVGFVITALVVLVVTGYGAWRVARKVERSALLHGFLVGLVVALLSVLLDLVFLGLLVGRKIDPAGLILYALMIAAGWLGGILGGQR